MRKVMILLMIFLHSNIFAAMAPNILVTENPKPVNIAFFIDDENERFGAGKFVAITKEFARTISQNASTVTIVSNYVLKNMILRKYTKNPDKFLNSLSLDFSDWDIYHIDNTQFFVFVPPNYDNPILNKTLWTKIDLSLGNEYNGNGDENFPIIRWADGIPIEVKRLLSNENMMYITYANDANSALKNLKVEEKTAHKKFNLTQLSLIFNPVEDYEQLSSSQPCNVFMTGHGGYSPEVKLSTIAITSEKAWVAGMSIDDFVDILIFFNDKLNTKSVRLLSCYSGGRILDLIRIKNFVPIRIKYLLIVDSLTDAPSYESFPLKPTTNMGLDLKGYFDALDNFQESSESFEDEIKTIKSKSTDPSEIIQSKIKKLEQSSGFNGILKKLLLPRAWYFSHGAFNNFPQILIPEIGCFQTFNVAPFVQKITDATIIKALAQPEFLKEEITEIEDSREEPSQLKKVTIKTGLKKMSFVQAETIEINKKLALLVYSEIVSANLNIIPNPGLRSENLYVSNSTRWLLNLYKYFPSIPCTETVYASKPANKNLHRYPQFVSMQRGNSLNLFAKINVLNSGKPTTETGILNFLRDSFLILRNRKSEKVFFIKELEGYNDFSQILDRKDEFKKFLRNKKLEKRQITLQNVFIKTSRDNLSTVISISFNFGGKDWSLVYSTKDLNLEQAILPVDKSQSLWRFKEDKSTYWPFKKDQCTHKQNLESLNLTYFAKLSSNEYYAQLPIIRDIFHYLSTNAKIKNPSNTLSFRDFIAALDPAMVKEAINRITDITASEWASFEQPENQSNLREKLRAQTQLELGLEQQFRLQLKLKQLKTSLKALKQKLLILGSKLQLLKNRLIDET